MDQTEWPKGWTQSIGREVARLRKRASLTADALSARCAEFGHPIPRSVIANLENGRREGLTLHELVVLAAALDESPLSLAYPPHEDDEQRVQYLPGDAVTTMTARARFSGDHVLGVALREARATAARTVERLDDVLDATVRDRFGR